VSKIRRTLIAVVSTVLVVAGAGVIVNRANRDHQPASEAAAVRNVAPAAATPPIPPNADFAADTFLFLVTGLDPTTADKFVDALSSADRAVLAADLENRVGLSAG
jgi:hypothetical protein